MTKAGPYHPTDTIDVTASLPRDLTGAGVELLYSESEDPITATIDDAANGDVSVSLADIPNQEGLFEIKWEITYSDGDVEVIPAEGDYLEINS